MTSRNFVNIGSGNGLLPDGTNVLIVQNSEMLSVDIIMWVLIYDVRSQLTSPAHNFFLSSPIVLKFCTEHGSDTPMPCAKFQNDWTT